MHTKCAGRTQNESDTRAIFSFILFFCAGDRCLGEHLARRRNQDVVAERAAGLPLVIIPIHTYINTTTIHMERLIFIITKKLLLQSFIVISYLS